MAMHCSAGILIWKDNNKGVEPSAADPHPGEALGADSLLAHFTLLTPSEHSKPGVGANVADLALLYAQPYRFIKRKSLARYSLLNQEI